MRLGLWPCRLEPGTKAAAAYGESELSERHRHRFEVNNAFRRRWPTAGLIVRAFPRMGSWSRSWSSRIIPSSSGSSSIPSSASRPTRPHPLFRDFIGAAKETLPEGAQRALPLEEEDEDEVVEGHSSRTTCLP